MKYLAIKTAVVNLLENEKSPETALSKLCEILQNELDHYSWVGFYFMDHNQRVLHLGPYAGEPTEHTRIPFGKGICGQVADSGQTFTVSDVTAEDNYIACSHSVKSEIVVPLYLDDQLLGQIDVDSNDPAAFSEEDELFISDICTLLAQQYRQELGKYASSIIDEK